MVYRTGHVRVPDGSVDGVVDCGGPVRVAEDLTHDQILPSLPEPGVVGPSSGRVVGEEHPPIRSRGRYQVDRYLTALVGTQIECDGPFSLVETCPVEAGTVAGDWPAPVVESSADGVEADHVRRQLGQRHSAQRSGDEGRTLDHPHAGQQLGHRAECTEALLC